MKCNECGAEYSVLSDCMCGGTTWTRGNMLAALNEKDARITELEAERESWGNEFSAVCMAKDRIAELENEREGLIADLIGQEHRLGTEIEIKADRIAGLENECTAWAIKCQAEQIEKQRMLAVVRAARILSCEPMVGIDGFPKDEWFEADINLRDALAALSDAQAHEKGETGPESEMGPR